MTIMTEHSIIESRQNHTHTYTHKQRKPSQYAHKHRIMLADMADIPHFLSEPDVKWPFKMKDVW